MENSKHLNYHILYHFVIKPLPGQNLGWGKEEKDDNASCLEDCKVENKIDE